MITFNKYDLVRGFSEVVDMVNTTLAHHHLRVAYIAGELCSRLSISAEDRAQVVMASMLHDLGVIPLQDSTDDLVFESDMNRHSLAGYLLLASCPLTRREAELVRYHHTNWRDALNLPESEREVAFLGNLIHLADIMDVHIRIGSNPDSLRKALKVNSGRAFSIKALNAAEDMLSAPGFFESLTEAAGNLRCPADVNLMLSSEDVTVFSMLFSHVIDSRSPFTAAHSTGVAHLALHLYNLADLPAEERSAMFIASLLHDIGKMGVPLNLLEKPGRLTEEEFSQISCHAALSYRVLMSIAGFEPYAGWGAWHHEKLNGSGYPSGLAGGDIPLEARITAVADVMTAMTEDRPYRQGMPLSKAVELLDEMVKAGELDDDVVALVHDNLDEVNETRHRAQVLARHFFSGLNRDIKTAVSGAGNCR